VLIASCSGIPKRSLIPVLSLLGEKDEMGSPLITRNLTGLAT